MNQINKIYYVNKLNFIDFADTTYPDIYERPD